MGDYQHTQEHWERGYHAPNVDHPVFRFYGRILKPDFGIAGEEHERVCDFGCGEGAAVDYFHRLGFDAYGVDISTTDVAAGVDRWPHLADRLRVIPAEPAVDDVWFGGSFDVMTAIQSLYYLSEDDMQRRLESIARMLRPGGVFYATMMSTRHHFHGHSSPVGGGLREVQLTNSRFSVSGYRVVFTDTEDELRDRFSMFEPVHVGWYEDRFREDEGVRHHWTFVGIKPAG